MGAGPSMVALGLVSQAAALARLSGAWNVFLFFLGLAMSAAAAERAGLFRAIADEATRLAGGDQRRLLTGIYLAGALVTILLSNDATALLMTPVALAVARRQG